jgi:hypothetical protein
MVTVWSSFPEKCSHDKGGNHEVDGKRITLSITMNGLAILWGRFPVRRKSSNSRSEA